MQMRFRRRSSFSSLATAIAVALAGYSAGHAVAAPAVTTVPGMPPVVHPDNLYSEAQSGRMSAAVAGARTTSM
jgi:ACR3 family arsenite efflux pump ArsB